MADARIRRWRRLSGVLAAVGVVFVLVGGVGLALDGDDGAARAAPSAEEERTARADPAPEDSSPATRPVATTLPLGTRVEAFFAEWVAALQTGDVTFLLERLHPAVVERYGEPACQAYLGGRRFPAASVQVLSSDAATAGWAWETDGRSSPIADAVGVRLRRTEDGATFTESDAHVAEVDGEIRWFTDCGTPEEA